MIVELLPRDGIGQGSPVVIDAAQIIIRLDDGTPIGAAAHFGPDNAYAITHCLDKDFGRMLKALGVPMTVVVDTLRLSKPPAGARLFAGIKPEGA